MPDMEPTPTPSLAPAATAEVVTPRKRSARRDLQFQDDVPHQAAGRSMPDRVARALERATTCARIADDNRAKDVLILDLRQATPLYDFFVIATAATRRLANSIAIEVDVEMKKVQEFKLGMEGTEEGSWILIDYGDFVVHLFTPESRTYYSLEEIWGDAPHLDWHEPGRPAPKPKPPDDAGIDID